MKPLHLCIAQPHQFVLLVALFTGTASLASAEPDLLGGDLNLPQSSLGNTLIDDSTINTDTPSTSAQITPAQAADLVRRHTGGQIMSVNSLRTETGVIYGVKVLHNSGRMRVMRVDGQTGKILPQ